MDKITQILENVVRCKYFEAGVHIKNPIKNSYQNGLGRMTQILDHVVVVHIWIWDKRKSQINEYCDQMYMVQPGEYMNESFGCDLGLLWIIKLRQQWAVRRPQRSSQSCSLTNSEHVIQFLLNKKQCFGVCFWICTYPPTGEDKWPNEARLLWIGMTFC